ncbi:hypothetical protein MVES_002196 [Malassezia vespertilionis]|uniref:Uncharacterized protein n=1 Tax=Malassezia vespertilionis TaxID=2020962 RepID=A0A2N1JBA7_9BASI|nr:hypothetical protein MVES_002196 [Malassezia vespertilionis]
MARSRSTFTWLASLVTRLGLLYVLVAIFWRCPSHPLSFDFNANDKLLVCRELASAKEHITPVVHDFSVSARKTVDPYVGSYLDKAHHGWGKMQPTVERTIGHAQTIFVNHVKPGASGAAKHAHAWSLPHRKELRRQYNKHLHKHVNNRDVAPYVAKASEQAHYLYNAAGDLYEREVHPRLKLHAYNGYIFTRHTAFPFAHANYVKHAHPHISALCARAQKFVDKLLVKYGLRQHSFFDKVKETFSETVKKTESATVDKETGAAQQTHAAPDKDTDKLQAALDAELKAVEDALSKQESAMLRLTTNERDHILKEASTIRHELLTTLPDKVSELWSQLIDGQVSGVFVHALRDAQSLRRKLDVGQEPTPEWRQAIAALVDTRADDFARAIQTAEADLNATLSRHRGLEARVVQESVGKIRQQSRIALQEFYNLMENTEFQATYYDNEGWDSAMRRRGRHFREEVQEYLDQMTDQGQARDRTDPMTGPDVKAEGKKLEATLGALYEEALHGFHVILAQVMQDPEAVSDRAKLGLVYVDVHDLVALLFSMSEQSMREFSDALRLDADAAKDEAAGQAADADALPVVDKVASVAAQASVVVNDTAAAAVDAILAAIAGIEHASPPDEASTHDGTSQEAAPAPSAAPTETVAATERDAETPHHDRGARAAYSDSHTA